MLLREELWLNYHCLLVVPTYYGWSWVVVGRDGEIRLVVAARAWWWRYYDWSWVVAGCGGKIMAGRG